MIRRTPLPARSPKRAAQMRVYRRMVGPFLAAHPTCERCGRRATVVHHSRGRRGARLLDQAWWRASCDPCNAWAEDHTGEALASGWLHRIEGNDDEREAS